ncbi:MAG: hypothetical protein ACRYGB_09045 [Janthinobacterium lividum]
MGSKIAPGTEAHWFTTYDQVLQTDEPISFEDFNAFTNRWYSVYASRIGAKEDTGLLSFLMTLPSAKTTSDGRNFCFR